MVDFNKELTIKKLKELNDNPQLLEELVLTQPELINQLIRCVEKAKAIDAIATEFKVFRLIIAGGRDFNDAPLLYKKCDDMLMKKLSEGYTIEIISGMARGADAYGRQYGLARGYKVIEMPADWSVGKSGGYKRNFEMCTVALEEGYSGGLIAFYDGVSKGTQHMIDIATQRKLPLRKVMY